MSIRRSIAVDLPIRVPVELHIYAATGHGFGYRPRSTAASNAWPQRFQEWLMSTGFLKKAAVTAIP